MPTEYIEDVDLGLLGTHTLKVAFDYTTGEREYNGDNGSAPGCAEEYDITGIHIVKQENPEVLIDVTGLNGIDDDVIIEVIKQQREL